METTTALSNTQPPSCPSAETFHSEARPVMRKTRLGYSRNMLEGASFGMMLRGALGAPGKSMWLILFVTDVTCLICMEAALGRDTWLKDLILVGSLDRVVHYLQVCKWHTVMAEESHGEKGTRRAAVEMATRIRTHWGCPQLTKATSWRRKHPYRCLGLVGRIFCGARDEG
jgi:hypothetical protein